MKEIDESRFQKQKKKPEPIGFDAAPLADDPTTPLQKPLQTQGKKAFVRSNGRTDVRTKTTSEQLPTTYVIQVPDYRRKIRHAFDIYEDHLDALKKIQLAEREHSKGRGVPTLGDMAQEALDTFITNKAKTLPNIELMRDEAA